jgi:sugar phosphate isomerase/epimerase
MEKKMKIGVRAHDFGRHSIQDLPKVLKDAGFDCTQLAFTKAIEGISTFADITDKHLHDVAESFAKNNVDLTVLGSYIEPSVPDKETRLANVATFCNSLSHAKKIGIDLVGTETTHLAWDTPDNEREPIYQLLLDSTLRMVETAEKLGVNVGIEPVAVHPLHSPELTKRLIDEVKSDRLKIIFDPVNLLLAHTIQDQHKLFDQVFTLLGEHIAVIHVKDMTAINGVKDDTVLIGTGLVDYAPIVNFVKTKAPHLNFLREGVKMDSYKQDLIEIQNFVNV